MKELNNKTKILVILMLIIIVAGVAIITTKGFNFELKYQSAKKIQLYIEKQFEMSDIKKITDEELKDQPVILQKVEIYEDTISIISKDITDEQKTNIINKINEKYGTELSADTIETQTIPSARGRDIIKPYIIPFVVVSIIILVYIAIMYRKLGAIKVVGQSLGAMVVAEALLASIIAIVRIPIGRITMPLAIIVYVATIYGLTSYFEKKLEKQKAEEDKQ